MRSRPLGTDLSPDEAATVARFDAAWYAPESLVDRLAVVIANMTDASAHGPAAVAEAVLAVMRGTDA